MKKIVGILVVLMLIMGMAGCAGSGDSGVGDDTGNSNDEVTRIVLLVSGSLGDKSFHDSSQAGMDMIKEKYGDKVDVKTIEMGSDKTKFIPTLEDVSSEAWDIIITGTFHMKEPIEEVAPLYPDKTYILFDTAVDYVGV